MNREIIEALSSLNIPCYFINKRDDSSKEYIIFSYSETPRGFADDEECVTEYIVFLNLYMQGNFIETKKQIVKLMKMAGYTKRTIPNAYWEESLKCYNQSFQFTKIIESEE